MKRLINQQPSKAGKWLLGALPFILILLVYLVASNERLAVNPNDKLMPSFEAFGHAIHTMAFEPSKRTGDYLLWADTLASLQRLGIGVGISALISLVVGILIGIIPLLRASFAPVVTVISLVPPLAILPILFIIFGLGEVAKITLIVLGITPFLIRDVQLRVMALPEELIIKAQTLGASTWQLIVRVVLPQVLPKLIDAVRLSLGAAWLFLIAAEAISATEGLGYRIFLVRRYLAMDVILPYVLWITLLAFLTDYLLRRLSLYAFPWQQTEGGAK
ncbi:MULTISPECIES: ABC transporter permease [Methylophaga]|jgi:NitT/TauT family transport system permease protein|uniref:ABC transporter permease n=3 Tax=Methylophaga TaxID=40222 RepID=A0ABN0TDV8_9GAMM|nr:MULTISPECIES: ABC transporter permease [Methylophaga]BDZ72603.1 ABC transporter permease [Methylophaga marina]|tara:strand:- start:2997 stop:3821 length:825 start_codon:yes stop_codon:yes gene_type:complete